MAGLKLIAPKVTTSSALPLDSLFLSRSSPSFSGSRSMVSFEDINKGKKPEIPFFGSFNNNNADEEYDEYFHQPGKKRRLAVDKVQFLEKSFDIDNRLEPERKVQLAKEVGLQPRQVAIWFQNRRARWKSKNIEKDYDALRSSYDALKADYESLLKEKEKLSAEVLHLSDKLLLQENENTDSNQSNNEKPPKSPYSEPTDQSVSEGEASENPAVCFNKLENISSVKSNFIYSSLKEAGDASNVFDPDQSDLSHDEEGNLSKNMLNPSLYIFPKIEDDNYPDSPTYSGYYEFPLEDQALEFWPC